MEAKVVSQEMALLSNIMAAYTFIAGRSNIKKWPSVMVCNHTVVIIILDIQRQEKGSRSQYI